MREGFERAVVVARADHHERLARGVKRVQVEQHLVRPKQRAQHPRDPVLEILRNGWRHQLAVQVALAFAGMAGVGKRVGDRHQRELAAPQRQPALVERLDHLAHRRGAAGLVAMHGAEHDQPWAGLQAEVLVNAQAGRVGGREAHGSEHSRARPGEGLRVFPWVVIPGVCG